MRKNTMTAVNKLACQAAALLALFAFSSMPAKAQLAGPSRGDDMMTQMAPMLNMMKAKMGKRRFAAVMQTMGPMMGKIIAAEGGSGGGLGGIPGGLGGMLGGDGIPGGFGSGGEIMGMLGDGGMMSMLPQVMQMANIGGGGHHRFRHHRRR
jgi:hypothetical protein